ncbi:MAG: glycosyltransferase family 4 protein [Steroidobacteraceae bacterium]
MSDEPSSSPAVLEFLVPGDIGAATGGYVYARQMIAGLRDLGWTVHLHELDASFPFPHTAAVKDAAAVLAALPRGAQVLIDGLALGAMPAQVEVQSSRLRLGGLIHHPLRLETGLAPALAQQLAVSECRALRSMARVIVTSAATAALLIEDGVPPERVAVVEPGVDAAAQAHRRGRAHAAAVAEWPRLLCVATLTPRKGHALLIAALQGLGHLPWQLDCIGSLERSPEYVLQLREQIDIAGLDARVALRGEVSAASLVAFYAQADLFVLPTLYEGYCMAVAEAVAHGIPVLSTRTGAIPQLVHAGAGILIEPGDGAALQCVLHELLGQRDRLSRLAELACRPDAGTPRDWGLAAQELAAALLCPVT